jgi:hypothetical protein
MSRLYRSMIDGARHVAAGLEATTSDSRENNTGFQATRIDGGFRPQLKSVKGITYAGSGDP